MKHYFFYGVIKPAIGVIIFAIKSTVQCSWNNARCFCVCLYPSWEWLSTLRAWWNRISIIGDSASDSWDDDSVQKTAVAKNITLYQTFYKISTGFEFHNASNTNCLTAYKMLYNLAPSYLADLCILVTAVATMQQLRSSSAGNLVVPKPRSDFGKRAFAITGPHAWNNLPQTIKSSASVAVFKKYNWRHFSQTML